MLNSEEKRKYSSSNLGDRKLANSLAAKYANNGSRTAFNASNNQTEGANASVSTNTPNANSGISINEQASDNSNNSHNSQSYYDQLKSESYRAMLNAEVQAANAKDQAAKYTMNSLRANGYGSQGMSESAALGINNQYQQALRDASNQYRNELLAIEQQQKQSENSEFEQLATLMSGATNGDDLRGILTEYGLWDAENGTWNLEEMSKLDKNTQNQLRSLYLMYNSQFETNDWLSKNTLNGTGFRDSGTAIQNVVDSKGNIGGVSNELNYIFTENYMGTRRDGDVVKLVNGSSDSQVVYMIYYNGSWYQTTGAVFSNQKRLGNNADTFKGL